MRTQLLALGLAAAVLAPAAALATPESQAMKGLEYLRTLQGPDGCIRNGVQHDAAASAWTAIAFARAGIAPSTVRAGGASLQDCVLAQTAPVDPAKMDTSLPALERQVLAMVAMGLDPRMAAGFDAVRSIESAFDGTQLGDPVLLNDDVFGLQALHAAGVPDSAQIIQKERAFIAQNQQPGGAWGFESWMPPNADEAFAVLFADVDDTSQAMVALLTTGTAANDPAILRAEGFIKLGQSLDGGCTGTISLLNAAETLAFATAFGGPVDPAQALSSNTDSTAWAIMGLTAAGQDLSGPLWTEPVGHTLPGFVMSMQAADGHFDWQPGNAGFSPISTTAYAVIALLGHDFVE